MKPMFRLVLIGCLAISATTYAQTADISAPATIAQASRFVGTWTLDVEGQSRQRTLVISQEGETLQVAFGRKEPGAKLRLIQSALDAGGVLTMRSDSNTAMVMRRIDDNTLKGEFTTSTGKVLNATMTRSTGENSTLPTESPTAATKPSGDQTEPLPAKMAGRWQTDDGRFGNTYEVIVESVDGTTVKGILILWSGRCHGKPARFVGTYEGIDFKMATGSDSPCNPVKYSLKRKQGGQHLFEGRWDVGDYQGTAYLDSK
jgi:hypothetical protein